MNSKLISQRVNSDPKPFILRLSDGSKVRVAQRDFVAVSPSQVLGIGPDESVTKIDSLHVVAIEEPGKTNGRRKQ